MTTSNRPRSDATADRRFEQYVLPEIDVMLRVARSLTRNGADAEDLVQDSLLRAYRAIDRFDGRYPRAWLLTIVRNTHINRNRRRRPELLRDPDASMEQLVEAPARDHADAFIDDEFDTVVVAALERLDPKFREVVELVDIEGLSYAEAAEVVGVPVGTVMSRLHRARKKVREALHDSGVSPRAADDVTNAPPPGRRRSRERPPERPRGGRQ